MRLRAAIEPEASTTNRIKAPVRPTRCFCRRSPRSISRRPLFQAPRCGGRTQRGIDGDVRRRFVGRGAHIMAARAAPRGAASTTCRTWIAPAGSLELDRSHGLRRRQGKEPRFVATSGPSGVCAASSVSASVGSLSRLSRASLHLSPARGRVGVCLLRLRRFARRLEQLIREGVDSLRAFSSDRDLRRCGKHQFGRGPHVGRRDLGPTIQGSQGPRRLVEHNVAAQSVDFQLRSRVE